MESRTSDSVRHANAAARLLSVLAHFDASFDTTVTTDASAVAIAIRAVVSQTQYDCSERPVAFASCIILPAKRAYFVSKR